MDTAAKVRETNQVRMALEANGLPFLGIKHGLSAHTAGLLFVNIPWSTDKLKTLDVVKRVTNRIDEQIVVTPQSASHLTPEQRRRLHIPPEEL